MKKFINSLSEITENGGGILGSFKDILDGVKGSLEAWQSSLKAGTLLKIGWCDGDFDSGNSCYRLSIRGN